MLQDSALADGEFGGRSDGEHAVVDFGGCVAPLDAECDVADVVGGG